MRSKEEFTLVRKLKTEGKNNSEISRITKIPRGTIKDWINNPPKHFLGNFKKDELLKDILINKNNHSTYSYILGIYLGDGHINSCERTFRMRISLDKKYKELNNYALCEIKKMFKKNKVSTIDFDTYINISVYNSEIPNLFPQHGKGKKHDRNIVLEDWQKKIIIPNHFIKGLYHSDGCYYTRIVNEKEYPCYEFSNKSKDILQMFKKCCDDLNIEYTSGDSVVRIYKRSEVDKLKNIIGNKNIIK